MANKHLQQLMRHIRKLAGVHSGGESSDGQLLERYVAQGDETAFSALLERHGPMVQGVCRRVLHDVHLAEDAFQVTFLILVRKARWLRQRDRVGNWLYGVAWRVARKARVSRAKLPELGSERGCVSAPRAAGRVSEAHQEELGARASRPLSEMMNMTTPDSSTEADWRELRPLLDEAVQGLPDKYREPFVLCCLEGKSNAEAARQLGCPEGTLFSRLSRARERLRTRLSKRGLALSTAALTTLVAQNAAAAAVPTPLFCSTIQAAATVLSASTVAGAAGLSASSAALMKGVLYEMFLAKIKIAAAVLLSLGLVAGGVTGVVVHQVLAEKEGAGELAQNDDPPKPKAENPPANGQEPPAQEALRPKEVRLKTKLRKSQWLGNLAFSPDAKLVAGQIANSMAAQGPRLWDAVSGKELHKWEVHKGNDFVEALAFSPDSKLLAAVRKPRQETPIFTPPTIVIWDTATGKEIACIPGHGGKSLCFSPDEKSLAADDADGFIRLWDVSSGKEVRKFSGSGAMAFSPDGKLLAAGSGHIPALSPQPGAPGPRIEEEVGEPSSVLVLWEIASGKEIFRIEQKEILWPITFSPDGKTLCCHCYQETVGLKGTGIYSTCLWDVGAKKKARELTGTNGGCLFPDERPVYSPSGRFLVSTTYTVTGTAVVLREAATGKWFARFHSQIGDSVGSGAVLFLDDKTLLTVTDNGTIKSWDLSDLPPNLTDAQMATAVIAIGGPPQPPVELAPKDRPSGQIPAPNEKRIVEPTPTVELAPKDLESLWTDLAGDDAAKAYQAIATLQAAPKQAVPFLKEQLRPASPVDTERIHSLIADLDNDQFAVREKAREALEQLGSLAEPALREKFAGKVDSLEQRRRIERLLEKLVTPELPSSSELRELRAVQVLESAAGGATPEAKELLKTLATGAEGARLTREAKASLGRLSKASGGR